MTDFPMPAVKMGFERDTKVLKISQIVPLKILRNGTKDSQKYRQILASIRSIGLVEPPVVTPDPKNKERYFLLDGLVRIEVLKDLMISEVECLISTEDEGYTYNKRINRLAAVQEHRMIVRAMDRGVSAEKIADALGLNAQTIRQRFRMLDGICEEAIELLKDVACPIRVFDRLREMAPIRQIEAAELMLGQGNFSVQFAMALRSATPDNMLAPSVRKKGGPAPSVSSEQLARLERELAGLQMQVKSIEETYGIDNLHLTVAKGYIAKLVRNPRVIRWFERNRQEYLSEFIAIAEISGLGNQLDAAE